MVLFLVFVPAIECTSNIPYECYRIYRLGESICKPILGCLFIRFLQHNDLEKKLVSGEWSQSWSPNNRKPSRVPARRARVLRITRHSHDTIARASRSFVSACSALNTRLGLSLKYVVTSSETITALDGTNKNKIEATN